jgi:hypothetical protein
MRIFIGIPLPATAAADSALQIKGKNAPTDSQLLTESLHVRLVAV